MPELDATRLWDVQARAIANLEESLRDDRPRALIQMATGSGKTFTAANVCYRLIRHADAKRILFLVDRSSLGEQAKLEFDKFDVPDTQRKFPAEYNVQHLKKNTVDPTSRVCISTIQRVFSILRGDEEMDEETDEHSVYELPVSQPLTVEYNPELPPDAFDVIIIDECHRSIYGVWRQVLEYFDAHLIGLTATPTRQTYGFFRQNLVMEYSHESAVADGVNVDFTFYIIKTAITESGSKIETGEFAGYRDRMKRTTRWEAVDEPVEYTGRQLDRAVVAPPYFEQMVGRGVRVIDDTDFQDVTDDAQHKERFFVVDAVGVTETDLMETLTPLERKPSTSLRDLMKMVGFGNRDPEVASTLAGRLARLDKQLPREDREMLAKLAGGAYLGGIAHGIVDALDPDLQLEAVRRAGGDAEDEAMVSQTAREMVAQALKPLSSNPELRNAILDARRSFEQTIDEVSKDTVLFAGHSEEGREKAAELVGSFRQYIEEHKDDIRALQVLYSRPYSERITFVEIKDLATTIQRPPRQWTPERLWHAYETLDQSKVRGSGGRMLTDIVSLVRYTLDQDDELVPFRDQVDERFAAWLLTQEQQGVTFTDEQRQWLEWMKENIAAEMGITAASFEYTPFAEHGGIGKAVQIFGERLTPITDGLTEALAA